MSFYTPERWLGSTDAVLEFIAMELPVNRNIPGSYKTVNFAKVGAMSFSTVITSSDVSSHPSLRPSAGPLSARPTVRPSVGRSVLTSYGNRPTSTSLLVEVSGSW